MQVEGKNPVSELLECGYKTEKIYIQNGAADKGSGKDIYQRIINSDHDYTFIDKIKMQSISLTNNHQGFIAVIKDYRYTPFDELLKKSAGNQNSLIVVLDGIEDPQNLGSIIRSCECSGVDGIVLPDRRSAAVNETVIKVSCGAAFNINIAKVVNINSALKELKEQGYWVYGAAANGENMYLLNMSGKTVLVIGNEGDGIKKLVRKNCDKIVAVPMRGKINSLNASVACAVLVCEIKRQSDKSGG